jgi:hypothetical protein
MCVMAAVVFMIAHFYRLHGDDVQKYALGDKPVK